MTRAGQWWLCPNSPRCPHAALFHDVYDEEDQVPRCCTEGCDCGRAEAEARNAGSHHARSLDVVLPQG